MKASEVISLLMDAMIEVGDLEVMDQDWQDISRWELNTDVPEPAILIT